MVYAVEDEIDWSDGPLGPSSPECKGPPGPNESDGDSLWRNNPSILSVPSASTQYKKMPPGSSSQYEMPLGSPLPFSMCYDDRSTSYLHSHAVAFETGKREATIPSRAQRARAGIHLNRRQPTKDDYMKSVLYQANQKAYEATLLKKFVAHALHPDRVAECFDDVENRAAVGPYLQSVIQNVKGMADKMIWNAHCRAVNLLANDNRDGAPFLDVNQLSQRIFSDFGPNNTVSVVERLNESWHRAIPEPAMVQMSTKQYPIGSNSSPLEEIDEIADKIFNEAVASRELPTGRATKPLYRRKGKGCGEPGAVLREEPQTPSRCNWLAFPSFDAHNELSNPPLTSPNHRNTRSGVRVLDKSGVVEESPVPEDLLDLQPASGCHPKKYHNHAEASPTRLEDLYDRYGAHALDSDRIDTPAHSEDDELVAKVPSWRMRLITDHKRRLTQRWGNPPQTLRRVLLPSIKEVIAEAMKRGYRPTSDDYESKLKIIEVREQRQATALSSATSQSNKVQSHSEQSRSLNHDSATKKQHVNHVENPKKRQKTNASSSLSNKVKKSTSIEQIEMGSSGQVEEPHVQRQHSTLASSFPAHPSGSTTLEPHQSLPTNAYFEPQNPDEKPAWRCGTGHSLGYYYNAGNRTACPGCFVNIKDNLNKRYMDFYLPQSAYSFQPAPDLVWTPSRRYDKERRSKSLCHNSIAKAAYWAAIDTKASAALARQAGEDAVRTALQARAPKKPPPTPIPEPKVDLGPHPSGSATMEHGQDLPTCAYFEPQGKDAEHAWRCDVNHALGRYYLAGDKRSCPGCGSNKTGGGKHFEMDFYMPRGAVVRQEAPELSHWAPRKAYKQRNSKTGQSTRTKYPTHNQYCSQKYFNLIDQGHTPQDAVKMAIEELDAELESKLTQGKSRSVSENVQGVRETRSQRNSRERCKTSSVPTKRSASVLNDDETGDGGSENLEEETVEQAVIEISSSSDEETSGSDSE
jgi:hypothetical protein